MMKREWRTLSLDGEPRIACPGFIRAEFQLQLRLSCHVQFPTMNFESVNNGVSDLPARRVTHRRVMLNFA
jgi:hypothetical protein